MSVERTNATGRVPTVIHEFKRTQPSTKSARSEATGDGTAITDEARRLGQVGPLVSNSAEVRPDRVRELKAAIAEGTYEANDREVAKKLLARGL